MEKRRSIRKRIMAGMLALVLCLSMIPFVPGTADTQVEAAADSTVYVYGQAMYSYAYKVLELVNQERAKVGAPALVMDMELMDAAMVRSAENVVMRFATGSINHTRPNGERSFTVCSKSYGENLAAGQQSPKDVVEAWMNSTAGHREAILNQNYRTVGIGCFRVGDLYNLYWAQEFGYGSAKTGSQPADIAGFIPVSVSNDTLAGLKKSSGYGSIIGFAKPGWKEDSKGWRYYMMDGYAKDCWMKDSGKWYYLDTEGYMATGWLELDGKWYYMNPNGSMKTGWLSYKGKWYFLNPSGAMAKGWKKVSGKWYYFTSAGVMKTGWVKLSGKWYYLLSSGAMVTGTRKIKGKEYRFDSSGKCLNP